MRVRTRRLAIVIAALFIMSGIAQAEPEYIPRTDKIYLSIGCDAADTGTCNTTSYWLGKTPGNNSVSSVPQTVTPWNYAFSAAGEDIPFGPFTAGEDLPLSYTIRTDQPIRGQVTVSGYAGPHVSADTTMAIELAADNADPRGVYPMFDRVVVNKQTAVGAGNTHTFTFEIPWPADLADKTVLTNLSATLYFKGVHVLTSGFIDGEGGSFLNLPNYEVVEAAPAPTPTP